MNYDNPESNPIMRYLINRAAQRLVVNVREMALTRGWFSVASLSECRHQLNGRHFSRQIVSNSWLNKQETVHSLRSSTWKCLLDNIRTVVPNLYHLYQVFLSKLKTHYFNTAFYDQLSLS